MNMDVVVLLLIFWLHLLLSCNSAFNFFLYCVISEQFCTELKKLFGSPASIQSGMGSYTNHVATTQHYITAIQ